MANSLIAKDVERALASDTRIDHGMIMVTADEESVVNLSGQVDTYNEKVLAEEIAGRVREVKDVQNSISVIPPVERSDEEITEAIRKNLELDTWVDSTKVGVETIDGVVFLRGNVSSTIEKQEAENDARWVAGVIDVVNHLAVKPETSVEDSEIATDIRGALIKNTRLDLTEMNVDVANGVVTLTGTVRNYTQKRIAEYVAFSIPGVVDVVNDLYVEGMKRPAA